MEIPCGTSRDRGHFGPQCCRWCLAEPVGSRLATSIARHATGAVHSYRQPHDNNDESGSSSTVLSDYPAANLVPGDVLQIKVGDKIPADARLLSIQSSTVAVDQGSLTGESEAVHKLPGDAGTVGGKNLAVQDQRGMLFAGTMVTRGSGQAIVVQTGMDTQFGRIQKGVTTAVTPKTPLAIKLDEFGATLTVIIGVICLAVWLVSIPKMNDPSFGSVLHGALYYSKVAVALGVAAIPEGLPAVITLCLSLGTRRMAERNVVVRKLPSVETLGCTSVICTDKTGTLTQNRMTAVSLVLLEHASNNDTNQTEVIREHEIDGSAYSPVGKVEGIISDVEVKEQPFGAVAEVAAVCALCNDAKIVGNDLKVAENKGTSGTRKKKNSKLTATQEVFERVGEPTEAALCVLAEKLGGMSHYLEGRGQLDSNGLHIDIPPSDLASANVDSWRNDHPRVATLEFNRDRKSMSVLCDFPVKEYPSPGAFHVGVKPRQSGNRLLVKGAPNLLLERCTHVKFRDGTVAKLSGELRRSIELKLCEMAARPLRCLALAIKERYQLDESLQTFVSEEEGDVSKHPLLSNPDTYRNIESGLTLVGIVGIKDPARPEAAESIKDCMRAGIRILMITGDARDTAVAIARDVNIFPREDDPARPIKAYEGREFFAKSDWEQLEILREGNIVFCRAEPSDKQKLVQLLQSLNEITAMTGDGVRLYFERKNF
jgi:P-type Ca2+ transporter type 2C